MDREGTAVDRIESALTALLAGFEPRTQSPGMR